MQLADRFRLDGKLAIVTGGAGLYGHSISSALAEAGARVIIASRDVAKCCELAGALNKLGYLAEGCPLDLEEPASIQAFVSALVEKYARIDILVNNAVSRAGFKNLGDITKEDWEKAQAVNSTGLILITQLVIKQMCVQGGGNIINIGSIQGTVGPNFPVYGDTGMTSAVNYTYDKW